MADAQLVKKPPQEETFDKGPFKLLIEANKLKENILVSCRNNRKLIGKIKAFDRHMNLVLEDVWETWIEMPKGNKGRKAKGVAKERYFSKLFLRGDSVILIVKKPH
jgi:small nuclear ribonucleoprotein D2